MSIQKQETVYYQLSEHYNYSEDKPLIRTDYVKMFKCLVEANTVLSLGNFWDLENSLCTEQWAHYPTANRILKFVHETMQAHLTL